MSKLSTSHSCCSTTGQWRRLRTSFQLATSRGSAESTLKRKEKNAREKIAADVQRRKEQVQSHQARQKGSQSIPAAKYHRRASAGGRFEQALQANPPHWIPPPRRAPGAPGILYGERIVRIDDGERARAGGVGESGISFHARGLIARGDPSPGDGDLTAARPRGSAAARVTAPPCRKEGAGGE